MGFMVRQDIESVMEIAGCTMEDLAYKLGVSRITVSNWINGRNDISAKHMNEFYDFAFREGIRLNKIKEQLYREDMINDDEELLFHGSKTNIDGDIRIDCNKMINDFGNGFYCGQSLEQSVMFVASKKASSLYMLKFKPDKLKFKRFHVDREWLLTVAYYRGRLEEYADTDIVRSIAETKDDLDYIIAPIADNRMFEIIDNFIDGEITDVQCQHCLSATNLGMQYVFVSERALANLEILEHCCLSSLEKENYLLSKKDSYKMNQDKVKLARKQYRNQVEYIGDIMI